MLGLVVHRLHAWFSCTQATCLVQLHRLHAWFSCTCSVWLDRLHAWFSCTGYLHGLFVQATCLVLIAQATGLVYLHRLYTCSVAHANAWFSCTGYTLRLVAQARYSITHSCHLQRCGQSAARRELMGHVSHEPRRVRWGGQRNKGCTLLL